MPMNGDDHRERRASPTAAARAAEEVVQLYIHDRTASITRPVRELKAFRKIALAPGQSEVGRASRSAAATCPSYAHGDRPTVEPGTFDVWIAPVGRRATASTAASTSPPSTRGGCRRPSGFSSHRHAGQREEQQRHQGDCRAHPGQRRRALLRRWRHSQLRSKLQPRIAVAIPIAIRCSSAASPNTVPSTCSPVARSPYSIVFGSIAQKTKIEADAGHLHADQEQLHRARAVEPDSDERPADQRSRAPRRPAIARASRRTARAASTAEWRCRRPAPSTRAQAGPRAGSFSRYLK